jgi:HK97 family phage major capsid protein
MTMSVDSGLTGRLDQLRERRQELQLLFHTKRSLAQHEGRTEVRADERAMEADLQDAEADEREVARQIKHAEMEYRRAGGDNDRLADLSARVNRPAGQGTSRRAQHLTYPDGRPGSPSWIRDLLVTQCNQDGDGEARRRLASHAHEVATDAHYQELRDLSRIDTQGGYLSPPAWLMDSWISFARPGRAFANLLTAEPLPAGTDSLNVPAIISGTSTAVQIGDNQSISETDLVDSFVNAPVRTIAGQQGISLQLIDQSPLQVDQVVFSDLVGAYAVSLDQEVINGDGQNGHLQGINYTPGIGTIQITSQDIQGFYRALAGAVSHIWNTRFRKPTAIVMSATRWAWLLSQLDTTNRPLFLPSEQGLYNAVGILENVEPQDVVGRCMGIPIVTDPNITANADEYGSGYGSGDVVYVLRAEDIVLYESGVRARILNATRADTLTLLAQVYGYCALAVRYAGSICTISGFEHPTF